MYIPVSLSDFHDLFNAIRPDSFSYEGREALFNYLEEFENGTDSRIELDVMALCCEYTEDSNKNHLANYDLNSIEELAEHTTVIKVDDETSIIQDY